MLDSRGKWGKERKRVLIRGKVSLSSINICLARAQNIQVKVLEQIYNSLIESCMMTVEIWRLEGGWKEIEKVHEMFCKRIFGVPSTTANGAFVGELGRTNRGGKVVETFVKYWKRLWEMDETSLLREALKQQTIEKGENWLKKLEQELNRPGMGDAWRSGGENNNNVWKVVSKRCINTERQKIEANLRGKKSLALYNELKSSWKREKCIDICTFEERKCIGWWKMGIWRLKRMRGNIDKGVLVCPVCRKEGGGSHILQCEGTRFWGDRWLERKFTSVHPEIGTKKASNKMRDNWTKIAQYLIKNGKG
jgi:hypothetical protein